MKHITLELEGKMRSSLEDAHKRREAMRDLRYRQADNHGEDLPDPMSPSEAETNGWVRALEWVLKEGGCE